MLCLVFGAIGRFCVRRRWWVLLGWVLLVAAGAVASGPVFAGLEPGRASDHLESIQALDLIGDNATYGGRVLGLVDDVRIADPAVKAQVQAAARDVARIPDVGRVTDPYALPRLIATDGRAGVVVVDLARDLSGTRRDAAIDALSLRLRELQAAAEPERPEPAGDEDRAGSVYYEDASGKTHRRSVAEWIGFTAQRLYGLAHSELSRQFNVGCGDLDADGCRALDAKLRRELRTDALKALAFGSHKVFEAAEVARYGTEEGKTSPSAASTDPCRDAMRDSRLAEHALDAFNARAKARTGRLSQAEFAEEAALIGESSRAHAAVYATPPTTRLGQIMLLHYAQDQITDAGCLDGTPADGHETVWANAYRALAGALASPPMDQGNWSQAQADTVDLSGISVLNLCNLFERFSSAADGWSDLSCLPYVEECEAVSRVVDGEYERAGKVRDRIALLLRNRALTDAVERDAILRTEVAYELQCNGGLENKALLARINAAWGA